jgi:hypothetical protein
MIVKERIQKADGSIRFRNYLIQDKLGKGINQAIKAALPSASRSNAWKTSAVSPSKSSARKTCRSPRPSRRYWLPHLDAV